MNGLTRIPNDNKKIHKKMILCMHALQIFHLLQIKPTSPNAAAGYLLAEDSCFIAHFQFQKLGIFWLKVPG